ncbi:MAG TPA: hypothetical protein VM327_03465 [Candidatus Thermoplasmatota archaeon]|nr:hypothetical protein [Candidatus Thermoplasmatota archaeon]
MAIPGNDSHAQADHDFELRSLRRHDLAGLSDFLPALFGRGTGGG